MDLPEDIQSALLILQLQEQDAIELSQQQSGEDSDAQLALNLYCEDVQRATAIARDRQLLTEARERGDDDLDDILAAGVENAVAHVDQEAAEEVPAEQITAEQTPAEQGPAEQVPVGHETEEQHANDDAIEDLPTIHIVEHTGQHESERDPTPGTPSSLKTIADSEPENSSDNTSQDYFSATSKPQSESNNDLASNGSTSSYASIEQQPDEPLEADHHCVSCLNTFAVEDLIQALCSHKYCRLCIEELFQLSLTDDTLFPHRCCKKLLFGEITRTFLTEDTILQYEAKKVEVDTIDRTYCSDPTCSTFIPKDIIKFEEAVCPICSKATCAMCKAPKHDGDCPLDADLRDVLDLAETNGWRRCGGCGRMIELRTGCFHITYVLFSCNPTFTKLGLTRCR